MCRHQSRLTTNNFSKINPEIRSVAEAMEMYPNIELVATSPDAKMGLLNDWQTAMLYKGGFYLAKI